MAATLDSAIIPVKDNRTAARRRKELWKQIWKHRLFYLFLLPGLIWFFIFFYVPLYGIQVAFRDFTFSGGITGSHWAGLKYFKQFFDFYEFKNLVRNTAAIGLMKLLIGFPMPIILALLLNEVRNKAFKKTIQTVSYLPYFVSWVVVVTLMQRLLSQDAGPVTELIAALGFDKPRIMYNTTWFYQVVILSDIWKVIGWNSIIYIAAIAGVDQQLYEAAKLDGAGRFRQIWHVTLPGIRNIAIILFILQVGTVLGAGAGVGYEQLLLLNSPATADLGKVLDVYVITAGLQEGRLSYAAAIGLFQSIIGLILILTVNKIASRVTDTSLW